MLSPEKTLVTYSDQPVEMAGAPDLLAYGVKESVGYRVVKRTADLLVALAALLILLPVLLLVALLIKLYDRGPILYRQRRVGRYGKTFDFYKLRSMRVNADATRSELLAKSDAKGAAFKMHRDPRITGVGRVLRKTSLDECPQLFCVLKGTMSIVGPRPHLPSEVEEYSPEHHARLMVKPGLLCYREVRGRSHLSFEQWLELDLEYVRTRNLWVDLRIFLLAFPAVFSGKGAY